ncbi:MAG: acyltransferase [Alphaproteobacteria bacterium]|nr:acyltransferase [Alphaproteobacteria bacterium]
MTHPETAVEPPLPPHEPSQPVPAFAPAKGESELLALTSIRGIAAWWVVLFHLRLLAPWVPHAAIAMLDQGNLAVDLFFVLSGFVIALNYGDRLAGDWRAPGRGGVADFLFRRFARIYPLHLLILAGFAAYAAAAILFGSARLEDRDGPYLLASLFLVQNWGFLPRLEWNVPAWSISTEAVAYLLFPFLLRLIAPVRRPSWLLALLVVLLGLSVPAFFAAVGYDFPNAVPQTGLFRCIAQFAMGMLLCALYRRLRGRHRLSAPLLAAAAALGFFYAWFGLPVVALAWAALVLGLALAKSGLLAGPFLVWLGRISYATYLCHYLALTIFKLLFVEAGRPVPPVLLALYLLAVLAASALLYHGFERPAQKHLLAWWKSRGSRTVALAPAE